MQSGYILFDGTGIDLNVATEVTIAGSFARATEAIETGKPIFVGNVVNDDEALSPISVFGSGSASAVTFVFTAGSIVIADDDGVTFTAA